MEADQTLFDAALDQLDRRWPNSSGVAAAAYLDDGSVFTGVSLSNINAAMSLCAETSPIMMAYSTGRAVIATICVGRESNSSGVLVLAPCGACQERLALWGPDVEVGVHDRDAPSGWSSRAQARLEERRRTPDEVGQVVASRRVASRRRRVRSSDCRASSPTVRR